MIDKKYKVFYRLWNGDFGPYGLLVVTALWVFVASPLMSMGVVNPFLVAVFFAAFMFVGVLTVHPQPAVRYFVLVLAVLAVLTHIASMMFPGTAVTVIEAVLVVVAIGLFAVLVLKQFLVTERPAKHRIGAAIVVYLILGLLWSRLYQIAGLMIPGAFRMTDETISLTSYQYFSFVTLATIGYGDISPVHVVVRNLAILEAITGQMYIAVLIARLVSTSNQEDKKH